MKYSRYSIVVIIRVILISLNSFLLVWFFFQTNRPATTFLMLILLVFQTVYLISYLNRINSDLANFLIFLQENDTTLAFARTRIERSFKGLTFQLDKINQKLQTVGIEKVRQFQYLQAIVKQIDTGIIAFDQEGKIELFNQTAEEILGIHSIRNIHEIAESCPELAFILSPGDLIFPSPVKIKTRGKELVLAVKSGSIKFDRKMIRLISLHNIKSELEAGELDAWRRLIRIQRHEIINSITPITTLTTAIRRRFKKGDEIMGSREITGEDIQDALESVEVIENRSRGLIEFVERFKNLTDVPVLKNELIHLKRLFNHIAILYSKELNSRNILLTFEIVPEDLILMADEKLLEQVMINLVKNSLEAIQTAEGKITLSAHDNQQDSTVILQVIDNGTGIDKDTMENIFIPAFTTKENGSGIGLSIIRQIVQLHHGLMEVRSTPSVKTVFEIILPKDR
jgi:two-component system, NtrC family, nitrogen regulation sensor histidine kinase NtrY